MSSPPGLSKRQAQLRLYNYPHFGRLIITDRFLYVTPYTAAVHGAANSVYKFSRGELYDAFERLFALLWAASRPREISNTTASLQVYLAGSIQKQHAGIKTTWDAPRQGELSRLLSDDITLVNPAGPSVSSASTAFQDDLRRIDDVDVVLVDATDRRGMGVGVEVCYAKHNGKRIVSIVKPDSYYSYHGEMPSFVASLSDRIVPDLEGAARCLREYVARNDPATARPSNSPMQRTREKPA